MGVLCNFLCKEKINIEQVIKFDIIDVEITVSSICKEFIYHGVGIYEKNNYHGSD